MFTYWLNKYRKDDKHQSYLKEALN
ncbi:hypothetical protein [Staphylococcus simulans]